MSDFQARYSALNTAQKQAVDTIEGPVMVVAGPGTGKTELLSMRVANILRTTDALPQNILCLTYTESGAIAMRERLIGLIGADAYKVSIQTFHSFGTEVINSNGEYFYHGAHFQPADTLSSYEVLRTIFEKLPHNSPLSAQMNGEFTYLRDAQSAISDIKKSGLTSDELLAIIDRNEAYIEWLQPHLQAALGDRMSKKNFPLVEGLLAKMSEYQEGSYQLVTYEPLAEVAYSTLKAAFDAASVDDNTKPLSAWKRDWCEKNATGELTLKDARRCEKLRAVAGVYYDYLVAMQERALYDFDDMILRVVHATEVFDELRFTLQERYQYILVDEFQDTNDAQMRLLWNLTNNPSSEGRPNIMVVGDDDQAIYRFQGANISNILSYRNLYRDVELVTLTDNYRSHGPILELSRRVITQAEERLENSIETIDKSLSPHYEPKHFLIERIEYHDEALEYAEVAKRIASDIKAHPDESRAVIARHHRQLVGLLPFLIAEGVPVSYDRQDNVLDAEPVRLLELLARVVSLLARQQLDEVNGLMPELLVHPAWGIETRTIWQLSLNAYKERKPWLEIMLSRDDELADIAEWLITTSHLSHHEPLEYCLDILTGTDPEENEAYRSPLKNYYFSSERLKTNPSEYVSYLESLAVIRRAVREYQPNQTLFLNDFVYVLDKYRELGLTLQGTGHTTDERTPVELLTAHKSKGLEFDSVSIISLTDNIWGETARSRSSLISYPKNLPIGMGGDGSDEHIRLLFVALTRAKANLLLSSHRKTSNGKDSLPVAYLSDEKLTVEEALSLDAEQLQLAWNETAHIPSHTLRELLDGSLDTYKLSATHLGNYLDVSRGGPELFLTQNLLRFPQAMSPSAAFGSAVHSTLQRAHGHFTALGKKRPVEDLLSDFEALLDEHHLSQEHREHFAKRGVDALTTFFASRYDSFSESQRVEISFGSDAVVVGDARLTGAIDLMDIDEETKTIVVTDYKTGKSVPTWKGRTDYEKIKLHHYRQQLMFYKLLIENSRRFNGYTVTRGVIEFVEPDPTGTINRLDLDYDRDELESFKQLIGSVWQRIQALQFETDVLYEANLSGIVAFETDLLK